MTDGRMNGGLADFAGGQLPSADYAALAAVLAVALRSAGLPAGPTAASGSRAR